MAVQTPFEYYGDEDNWGQYQFIPLKEIIDELMVETTDTDSFLNNTGRTKILMCAKTGVKTLNREVKKSIKAFEMTVGPDLFFPLPQDYVDWMRISVVTPDGKLKPLDVNNNVNTAIGYLQDHDAEILFDNNGNILTSYGSSAYGQGFRRYTFVDGCLPNSSFPKDVSEISQWGECKIDETRGAIIFSSNLEDNEVVFEYISDGLELENLSEQEIKIHKVLKNALIAFIYMCVISKRRHVPFSEKLRAKNDYKALRHKALKDVANFDINAIQKIV